MNTKEFVQAIRQIIKEEVQKTVKQEIQVLLSESKTIDTSLVDIIEPRVKVLALDITPNEEQNAFGVYLQFDIINRTEPITIRFLLQRIR
jgi:hypothetical protein